MAKERDRKIDVLRFIGVMGILISHVVPPDFFMQLRSFDVPLMALLMGVSFYLSNRGRNIDYSKYVKKRFKRLVGPTWQFLTLFFGSMTLIYFIFGKGLPYRWEVILSSYLLLDGIGYVWIIGVFLGVALLNPFILKFSEKVEKNSLYFFLLLVVYLGYLGLTTLNQFFNATFSLLFEHLILYTIGYSIIAAIGIRLKKLSTKEAVYISIASFLIYFILALVNDFSLTSIAKYPPTTYYVSYAIGFIFTLYLLLDIKRVFNFFDNKLVYFISENSMWFYLWHIIPVVFRFYLQPYIPVLEESWLVRFIYVFIVTLILTVIHKFVMNKIKSVKIKDLKVA